MGALGVAGGNAQLAGIVSPELWSKLMQPKFYTKTAMLEIANTDWEGEIKKFGCKVNIRTLPDVTVADYTKHGTTTMQNMEPSLVELEINKGKYWYIKMDNVDLAQADMDWIQKFTNDASEQMKIKIDAEVLQGVYADPDATNKGAAAGADSADIDLGAAGAPKAFTTSTAVALIENANVVLDENNVPDEDRYIILPPWAVGQLKQDVIKNVYVTGDKVSPLRNGVVGNIDRMKIIASRQLKSVTDSGGKKAWYCLFGHKKALTFASQFIETVFFDKLENTAGKAARGINVFGYKVIQPKALGCLYVSKS